MDGRQRCVTEENVIENENYDDHLSLNSVYDSDRDVPYSPSTSSAEDESDDENFRVIKLRRVVGRKPPPSLAFSTIQSSSVLPDLYTSAALPQNDPSSARLLIVPQASPSSAPPPSIYQAGTSSAPPPLILYLKLALHQLYH